MTMSARRTISSEFGVLLCTIVTVASRRCNSNAAGVPTTFERPTTTASLPAMGTPVRSRSSMPPRGVHGAKLMLLVAQPEGEDDERLLSGPQGRLLAAILRAMGLAEEDTYCASALPRPAPLPDWTALAAQGLGDLTRHHIALAAPQRLLVFGRGLAPLLAENGEPAPALPLGGRAIPLMIAPRLDRLARMPGHRKQFWTKWLEWSAHA